MSLINLKASNFEHSPVVRRDQTENVRIHLGIMRNYEFYLSSTLKKTQTRTVSDLTE